MARYNYREVMGHSDWDTCPYTSCGRVYYYVPARPANPPTWEHWCPWCHRTIDFDQIDLDNISLDLSPTHSAFKLKKTCPRLHGVGNAPAEDAPAEDAPAGPEDYAFGAAGPEEDAPAEDAKEGWRCFLRLKAGDRQPLAAPGLVWTP